MTGQGDAAGSGPAATVLRFSCNSCGKELSAPLSAAGVTAPCPICGVTTQAPRLPVPDAGDSPPAEPVGGGRPSSPAARPGPGGEAVDAATNGAVNEAARPDRPVAPAVERRDEGVSPQGETTTRQDARRSGHSPAPRRRRQQRRTKGALDPITGLSAGYEDRKEQRTLIRIIIAVALTAAITFGVFYFLNRAVHGPAPKPSPGWLRTA